MNTFWQIFSAVTTAKILVLQLEAKDGDKFCDSDNHIVQYPIVDVFVNSFQEW